MGLIRYTIAFLLICATLLAQQKPPRPCRGAGDKNCTIVAGADGVTTLPGTTSNPSGGQLGAMTCTGSNCAISATVLPGTAISSTAETSVTLTAANNGQIMRFTAGTDVTLTLNTDIAVAGFSVLIVQRGAGAVVPTAGAGVTIRQRQSYTKTAGQYAIASLVCDIANDCILSGDLQ